MNQTNDSTPTYSQMMNILRDKCHKAAKDLGWWPDAVGAPHRNKGELIALMHSELSEALEGIRCGSWDEKLPHRTAEEVELADTIIRILDYAGAYNLDIGGAMIEKLEYNRTRQDHKLENRSKPGGKKF